MTDTLLALLVHLTQLFGGNLGWAIVALSLALRVSLLPLTLRLSLRMLRNQEIARTLQPEIAALRKRFEKKPEKLFAEMQKVYKKHGYNPFDLLAIVGSFIQLPIFAVVYRAIRESITAGGPFLWIRSLASPDGLLTLAILGVVGFGAYLAPGASQNAKVMIIFIQVAVTGLMIWKLAAGLGLYWAASSVVGIAQSLWLRRAYVPIRTAA